MTARTKPLSGAAAALWLLAAGTAAAATPTDAEVYVALKSFHGPAVQYEFPADNTGRGGRTYTKATNIGLDLLSTLVAAEDGVETSTEARRHVARLADGLETLPTYRGIFPEYVTLQVGGVAADTADGRVRYSSIDSAWLHLALSVGAAYYGATDPALAKRLQSLVDKADYTAFLREDGRSFSHGLTVSTATREVLEMWPHDYDNKNSEGRLVVVFLTAAGKLPEDVWPNMFYHHTSTAGFTVADGWALSAFVEMIGNSYFDEAALAPRTLGLSHRNHLAASEKIALDKDLVVYGWAPCFNGDDAYSEYGLSRTDVATPYAAALLATTDEPAAQENLSKMLEFVSISDTLRPFPDAVDSATGEVLNTRALALDQNLFYHAIRKDTMRQLVAKTPWSAKARDLLRRMDEWHAVTP